MKKKKLITVPVKEDKVLDHICKYLKLKHPNIIYRIDFASGMRMTIGQAMKNKRLQNGRGFPDIFIYEPRGEYFGLAIELKKEGEKILNKQGKFKTPHLQEQSEYLQKLNDRKYKAVFGIGFEYTKRLIDNYLKDEEINYILKKSI